MARKPTEIDNTDMIEFFSNYEYVNEVSGWIEDCLVGASRMGHSNPSSPSAVFMALRTLPVISQSTVNRFVNSKSSVIDGRVYGERHVYAFMSRLLSARKGIKYHYERTNNSDFPAYSNISIGDNGDFRYADGVYKSVIVCKG